eukprot:CAMPEP_0194323912 /NCGR_PEP_ID=MMETSP0171-20130528/26037_1 /TAXON_ID=218684 /ORGANISM="Corethron pennatum, Strain L29A3" /LENGTH=193 /DNA_ID=CAMNT_0039082661 /DNA_START=56 /DNA_END=637 /DNA_ORIENTATION=-
MPGDIRRRGGRASTAHRLIFVYFLFARHGSAAASASPTRGCAAFGHCTGSGRRRISPGRRQGRRAADLDSGLSAGNGGSDDGDADNVGGVEGGIIGEGGDAPQPPAAPRRAPAAAVPTKPIAAAVVVLVAFLLKFYLDPSLRFDVDVYLALDGLTGNGSSAPVSFGETILELPRLGPAERIVGAFFGPQAGPF